MPVIKEQANNRLSGPLRAAPGYRMPTLGNPPLFIVKRRFSLPVPHPDPNTSVIGMRRDPQGRGPPSRGVMGPYRARVPGDRKSQIRRRARTQLSAGDILLTAGA